MKNAAFAAAAAVLAAAAFLYYRKSQAVTIEEIEAEEGPVTVAAAEVVNVVTSVAESAAQFVDTITGGALKISSMASVTADVLKNHNVRALLRVIRAGEGTADEAGYRRIFGGQLFTSFADHPRIVVRKNGYVSSAAGAYQFLSSTWDETRRVMRLTDFSPASQDLAAVGRIAARGALQDVIAGRFDLAIKKVNREWASMPGSPYGQPVISLAKAASIYAAAGGENIG